MDKEVTEQELHARLCLHATPRIGPQRYYTLLQRFSSALNALAAPAHAWASLGISAASKAASRSKEVQQQADTALHWAQQPQHHLLLHDSADYPGLLGETQAAPPILFIEGCRQLLATPQLAIVGSRSASPTNKSNAYAFARTLAAAGCSITSGLASGIDTAAHQGALKADGRTLAVMGTGLLHTYPKNNLALRQQILDRGGALISELCLNTPPLAGNFPKRNRIISGLSLGVLVVEASLSSGSLITARYAVEQNRDVFAIPGSIHYPGSRGCHQLIRDGAVLVEDVHDILNAWQHWLQPVEHTPAEPKAAIDPLCKLIHSRPMNTDQLAVQTGQSVTLLMQQLTELELQGKISMQAGLWHHLAPDDN